MPGTKQDDGDAKMLNKKNEELAITKAQLEQKINEIGKLEQEVKQESKKKNEIQGKYEEQINTINDLKSENSIITNDINQLRTQIATYQANEKRKGAEFQNRINQLDTAQQSLKDERARVIKEEQEMLAMKEAERDRMWKEHENKVIAHLEELCQKPQFFFKTYTNKKLPEGFAGDLEPDFMIDFLNQYVIFDAKESKAKNLQTYITDQVKKTIEKIKGNGQIYPIIFLVVPTLAINELKTHHYTQDGYTFYVISPESIAPILASYKRISTYEFAEQLDPQQRENIVQIIADLSFHIHLRNATDIFLSKSGASILDRTREIEPEIVNEADIKRQGMKSPFTQSEIKKMVLSAELQNIEVNKLIAPKPSVQKKHLDDAQNIVESLF